MMVKLEQVLCLQLYRASYVQQKFDNIKGGKQRADFLRSLWALKGLPEELSAQALECKKLIFDRKLECLADENTVLEEKVTNFGNSGKKGNHWIPALNPTNVFLNESEQQAVKRLLNGWSWRDLFLQSWSYEM